MEKQAWGRKGISRERPGDSELGEKLERGYSGGTVGSSQAPRSADSAAAMSGQTCK